MDCIKKRKNHPKSGLMSYPVAILPTLSGPVISIFNRSVFAVLQRISGKSAYFFSGSSRMLCQQHAKYKKNQKL